MRGNGKQVGREVDTLRQLQPGLSSTVTVTATSAGYCIQSVVRAVSAALRGPGSALPQAGIC